MSAAPQMEPQDLSRFAVTGTDDRSKTLVKAPNGTRFAAAMLDGFFYTALSAVGTAALKHLGGSGAILLWSLAFWNIYYILPIYASGQTLGKKLMKIQIISTQGNGMMGLGQTFKREFFGKLLSGLCFMLGYVAIFRHPEGRSWHDRWAKTRMISLKE